MGPFRDMYLPYFNYLVFWTLAPWPTSQSCHPLEWCRHTLQEEYFVAQPSTGAQSLSGSGTSPSTSVTGGTLQRWRLETWSRGDEQNEFPCAWVAMPFHNNWKPWTPLMVSRLRCGSSWPHARRRRRSGRWSGKKENLFLVVTRYWRIEVLVWDLKMRQILNSYGKWCCDEFWWK